MLLSTFYFALMNVMIKQIPHIPPMELVFFRCVISLSMCYVFLTTHKISVKGTNHGLLLARGLFGTLALYTFFITLHEMPLGTAVTIQYMSPIFTTIIGVFYLKEKLKLPQWAFFLISFSGILFLKGFDNRIQTEYLIIGILSAISSGFAYNMVRSLKEKEHPTVVVMHFQLIGAIIGLGFTLFNWVLPHGMDWFYLIATGIFTQLGQVNMTKALQMERVADMSILNYLGALYALIFGYILFGEVYGPMAIIGIVLILSGVVFNYFYQRRFKKEI